MQRGAVWKAFGEPFEQVGSVNEPRAHVECGVKWNEKWVYREAHEDGSDRVVLWNRYDFLGAFKVERGGACEPEPLSTE